MKSSLGACNFVDEFFPCKNSSVGAYIGIELLAAEEEEEEEEEFPCKELSFGAYVGVEILET